jgi:hypothetical protein
VAPTPPFAAQQVAPSLRVTSAPPPILGDWPPQPPRSMDDPTGRDLAEPPGARPVWREGLAAANQSPGAGTVPGAYLPASRGNGSVSGAYVPPAADLFSASPPPAPPVQSWTAPSAGYLPPSGVFSPAQPAGDGGATGDAMSSRGTAANQAPSGSASLFSDLPVDVPNTLSGWLAALGAGAASLGFLLPWSGVIVGSASTGGGYTETWGLASPSNLLVMLLTVSGFLLSVLPNRVPPWLRTGVLGMILGGLLIGLAWPYLFAGLGYRVGIIAELVGAALLIVAGVLATLPARHEVDESSV